MTTRLHSPGRRQWLKTTALPALAMAITPAWVGAVGGDDRAAWIPSDTFLADLPRLMQALRVPALGLAVVEGGELAWARTVGLADAVAGTPASEDTLFEAASLSKPVFAYLAMQLVDQGVLGLDAPLVRYHRPDYVAAHPWNERITVRDVLRHTTGLPNWRTDPATQALQPAVAPGTRIDYSGEAFVWLQLAVEALTGESLDQTLQRLLSSPAGLRDSSYAWSAAMAARSARGHRALDDDTPGPPRQGLREHWNAAQAVADREGKPLAAWRYEDAARALPEVQSRFPAARVTSAADLMANAAASLRTTPADYARLLALMLRPRRAPWEISDASRQAMLSRQIALPGRWIDKGLGWNLEATPRGPVIHHSGSNAGIFKTFALGDPGRQRGLVVLTNGGSGHLLYRRVVTAATGHDLLAFDL